MKNNNEGTRRPARVSEPVQVYLTAPQHETLRRLADRLGLTMSDVLRRGLEALERATSDPAEHPALRVAGLASKEKAQALSHDAGREHDRFLADTEAASWQKKRRVKRG
jgi:Arc/MetJ-type ribon-helix-helix transcriptional regulator